MLRVFFCFINMLCLGGIYAWSVFVPLLKKQQGYTTTQTQTVFGVTILVFSISMIFSGRLEKQFGPARISAIGAVLIAGGYLLASIGVTHFWVLLTGIGILGGTGIGFCYVCGITVPVRTFPLHKGLATGISVAGFGAGAIVLSFFVKQLTAGGYETLPEIFKYVGLAYGLVLLTGSFFLPGPSGESSVVRTGNFIQQFKDVRFRLLFFAFFLGTFSGLMVIGNAKPIALEKHLDESLALFTITVLSVGNMSGRIFWGFLSDKLDVDRVLNLALFTLLGTITALIFIHTNPFYIQLTYFMVGLGFSANMVLFAAKTAEVYGFEKLGLVYPLLFIAYGISGFAGPISGGLIFDTWETYMPGLILSMLMITVALVLLFMLKKARKVGI